MVLQVAKKRRFAVVGYVAAVFGRIYIARAVGIELDAEILAFAPGHVYIVAHRRTVNHALGMGKPGVGAIGD